MACMQIIYYVWFSGNIMPINPWCMWGACQHRLCKIGNIIFFLTFIGMYLYSRNSHDVYGLMKTMYWNGVNKRAYVVGMSKMNTVQNKWETFVKIVSI